MGARGRAPLPTETLRLKGSWRANSRKSEPQPERGEPTCPVGLPTPARAVWSQLCGVLESMNLLTTVDGAQLERYCRYLVRWRECEDFIDKNGQTYPLHSDEPCVGYFVKITEGKRAGKHIIRFLEFPQVKESHRLDKALKQIEASFGLTPSARARLTVSEPETVDPFEAFLNGAQASN